MIAKVQPNEIADRGERHLSIVELVGVAGSGKTTLLRELTQHNPQIQNGIPVPPLQSLPIYARQTLSLLPLKLGDYRSSRWFTSRELRSMVYLEAWHRNLTVRPPKDRRAVFIDHGPMFRLARLREFGPELTRSQAYERWWNGMLEQWVKTLGFAVWLDAPDSVLLERILARNVWHEVKDKSTAEGYDFLVRYREMYERLLSQFAANPNFTLLRFDTSQMSATQIAHSVLTALNLQNPQ
jgi:hypothetical protein